MDASGYLHCLFCNHYSLLMVQKLFINGRHTVMVSVYPGYTHQVNLVSYPYPRKNKSNLKKICRGHCFVLRMKSDFHHSPIMCEYQPSPCLSHHRLQSGQDRRIVLPPLTVSATVSQSALLHAADWTTSLTVTLT